MLHTIHDYRHDVLTTRRDDTITACNREHGGDPNLVLAFDHKHSVVGVTLHDASLYAATWRANLIRHGLPEDIREAIDVWMHHRILQSASKNSETSLRS